MPSMELEFSCDSAAEIDEATDWYFEQGVELGVAERIVGERVQVIAVTHQGRDPEYWRNRL